MKKSEAVIDTGTSVISIRDLVKSFGDLHVLRGVDLDLYKGENLVVLVFYDAYLLAMSLAVLAYTWWPSGIQWKERRYRWAEG